MPSRLGGLRWAARDLCHNKLVVIYAGDNPAGLAKLQDLTKPGLKLVLAAEEVRWQVLTRVPRQSRPGRGLWSHIQGGRAKERRFVRGERQSSIDQGTAGGGRCRDRIPDRHQHRRRRQGRSPGHPDALNAVATYPIAVVSDAGQRELARAFIDLVLSAQGQATLVKYGFLGAD